MRDQEMATSNPGVEEELSPSSMTPTEMECPEMQSLLLQTADNPTEKLLQQFIKLQLQKDNPGSRTSRSCTFPLDLPQKDNLYRFKSEGDSPNKEPISPVITELIEKSDKELIQDEENLVLEIRDDNKDEIVSEIIVCQPCEIPDQTGDVKAESCDQVAENGDVKKKGFWSRFKSELSRSFHSKKSHQVVETEIKDSEKESKEEIKDKDSNEKDKEVEEEKFTSEKVKEIKEKKPKETKQTKEKKTKEVKDKKIKEKATKETSHGDDNPTGNASKVDEIQKDEEIKVKKESKVAKLIRRMSFRKHPKKSTDEELSSPDSEKNVINVVSDNENSFHKPVTLTQALFNISNPYERNRFYKSEKTSSNLSVDCADGASDEDNTTYYVAEQLFEMTRIASPDVGQDDAEFKSVEQQLAEYLRNCGDNFNEENKAIVKSMFVKVLDSGMQDSQPTAKIARIFLFSTETAFLLKNVSKTLTSLFLKSTAEFVEDQFAYLLTGKEGWGSAMKQSNDAETH